MGEIMNVCNQLAKDNAYNKTMSTLQLIHTLSTKLSPKYGHYCYRNIMKLIRMMVDGTTTKNGEVNNMEEEDSDSVSDSDSEGLPPVMNQPLDTLSHPVLGFFISQFL